MIFNMTELEFLSIFCFTKDNLKNLLEAVALPAPKPSTGFIYFVMASELTTLILQLRLVLPFSWKDIVHIFRLQPLHLSRIFGEKIYRFCCSRRHLSSRSFNAFFR